METVLAAAQRQQHYPIAEATQVAAARRAVSDMATRLGFGSVAIGQASIVVTEAATNILKHAREGEILLRPLARLGIAGIEIVVIDSGPGMANSALAMVDGVSTAGTYGGGLGAMRRLSQEFDLFTAPDAGTVVALVLWSGGAVPAETIVASGAICLPIRGETVCGDSWAFAVDGDSIAVMMADGLGHGADAAVASERGCAVLAERPTLRPADMMQHAHDALRGSRGAAMAVAAIDTVKQTLTFAGIGNIAAHVYDEDGGGRRQLVSHNGIVGNNMRKVQEFVTTWPVGALLVLASDGLTTRWDLAAYPGIFHCHPRIIAAVLYRDFARGRDDVSVLVLRDQSHGVH